MQTGVQLKQDYVQLWREGMREWDGTISKRMLDDSEEEQFWKRFIKKKSFQDKLEAYVHQIQKELLALVDEEDKIIEIGPGWGHYTFKIAQKVKELTCVDSSESILHYLEAGARHYQLSNINFIHGKWEACQLEKRYDVVFGINCYYRMFEIDRALNHMNTIAKRLAIIGLTSGPEQPHYNDLKQELGYEIKFKRRDYIHLTNILYNMGIDVNCKVIPLVKRYEYASIEAALKDNTSRIVTKHVDINKIEKILLRYLRFEENKYVYDHYFKAVLLYWQPERY
jgi:ubiquinone/menaquinone biosynthesis C-methylase UbiE